MNKPIEVTIRSIIAPLSGHRSENQDNYLYISEQGVAHFLHEQQAVEETVVNWQAGHVRVAVLDGVGGHDFGRLATEESIAGLLEIPPLTDINALSCALEKLHSRLNKAFAKRGGNAGCTLTLLEIPAVGPAIMFHTGDSRLYEIKSQELECLTVDHVPATQWAMAGEINEQEWLQRVHHLSSRSISQAFVMGHIFAGDESVHAGAPSRSLKTGLYELNDYNLPEFLKGNGDRRVLHLADSTYLLASDGLWHFEKPQDFTKAWPGLFNGQPSLETAVGHLMDLHEETAQLEPDNRGDNTTLIALRIPPRQ